MSNSNIVKGKQGEYEYGEQIGKGSTGEVYRVKRLSDDNIFAMKVQFQGNYFSGLEDKNEESLPKELKIMRKLYQNNHKNLVSLIEEIYDPEKRRLYFIMEYFQLGNLYQYLQKQETLQTLSNQEIKVDYILKFSLDIASGVAELHRRNITHRDLKPENIMVAFDELQNSPFLKLIDFGTCNENDIMGSIVGTLNYMAPEILERQNYRDNVDIGSVGCIIHEMITGRQLFGGHQPAEIIAKIKSFQEYKEKHFLSRIVKKCLEVNLNKRIDGQKLQKELKEMLVKWQELLKSRLVPSQQHQNQQVCMNYQQQPKNPQRFKGWSSLKGSCNQQSLQNSQNQQHKQLEQQKEVSHQLDDQYSIIINPQSNQFNIQNEPFCQLDDSQVFEDNSQDIQISTYYEIINKSSINKTPGHF